MFVPLKFEISADRSVPIQGEHACSTDAAADAFYLCIKDHVVERILGTGFGFQDAGIAHDENCGGRYRLKSTASLQPGFQLDFLLRCDERRDRTLLVGAIRSLGPTNQTLPGEASKRRRVALGTPRLVFEVPPTGKDHRQAMFVTGGDHRLVAAGSARLRGSVLGCR